MAGYPELLRVGPVAEHVRIGRHRRRLLHHRLLCAAPSDEAQLTAAASPEVVLRQMRAVYQTLPVS